jgi:hypothetical protein
VFVTEQGSPMTTAWFLRMVARSGKAAEYARQRRFGSSYCRRSLHHFEREATRLRAIASIAVVATPRDR